MGFPFVGRVLVDIMQGSVKTIECADLLMKLSTASRRLFEAWRAFEQIKLQVARFWESSWFSIKPLAMNW